jgi:hypothetical protein
MMDMWIAVSVRERQVIGQDGKVDRRQPDSVDPG